MSRPVVVYVDDEPALCRVLAMVIRRAGAEPAVFSDPRRALAYIAEHEVAVVLCDYRMPQMTGLELLEQLEPTMPFYLVTGDLSIGEKLEGTAAVTGVIPKPFRPEAFVELLAGHLG